MKAYKLILTVAIAVLVIQGPPAIADTFDSSGSGAWNAAASWTRTGGTTNLYPQDGDTATIKAGHTIHVDASGQRLDHLTIEQGATKGLLELRAGGALRIDLSLTMQTHATNEDAEIHFAQTGTPAGILQIDSNMTAAGPIRVTGAVGGSITSVDAADTFTFQDVVSVTSGDLTISARFNLDGANGGKLLVDGATRTLTINEEGPVAGSSGRWEMTAAGTISIETTADINITDTSGHFRITNGTIHAKDASLTTAAGIRLEDPAKLLADAGRSLEFTGDYVAP